MKRFNSVPIAIFKTSGFDLYGQPKWVALPCERCDVVKLLTDTQHSTVRVDSGGSRGHADETVADAILLVAPTTKLERNDKLEVLGVSLKITAVRPRLDAIGKLDHFEVRGSAWPSK